ncbi:PTS system, mannose-specific IIA component [Desulfonauticus submarinus]|uniref:PTS system, mannose-specific IIA component n=1 Tax=Desulfonauticus submarinus TaxID=206665 RepID=A0A1G9ZMQ7_9BACT|nr:PTS sugar transporter subunit IIA [Desulfonauticus submarinus]SDN22628.1 PTS system, mannose-specific IIA component [Desulfonauticus submarinus]
MVGFVIVTHGKFGDGLLNAAEMIVGDIPHCTVISVDAKRPIEQILKEIEQSVKLTDNGDGVLVFTDMFGGTPTTLSLSLLGKKSNLEVITGVNLPILIKAATSRNLSLLELASELKKAGRQGIKVAGEILKNPVNS